MILWFHVADSEYTEIRILNSKYRSSVLTKSSKYSRKLELFSEEKLNSYFSISLGWYSFCRSSVGFVFCTSIRLPDINLKHYWLLLYSPLCAREAVCTQCSLLQAGTSSWTPLPTSCATPTVTLTTSAAPCSTCLQRPTQRPSRSRSPGERDSV